MLAVEVAGDRFYQHRERGKLAEATGLPYREDPFHPAITFVTVGAMHHLAPSVASIPRAIATFCLLEKVLRAIRVW
jgi:hypothetical protein